MTGGAGNTWLDRWGKYVGENNLDAKLRGMALGGARIPKGMPLPGGPSTTSIWTKVPCMPLWAGKWLGRAFAPLTIVTGAYEWYVIIKGGVVIWL